MSYWDRQAGRARPKDKKAGKRATAPSAYRLFVDRLRRAGVNPPPYEKRDAAAESA